MKFLVTLNDIGIHVQIVSQKLYDTNNQARRIRFCLGGANAPPQAKSKFEKIENRNLHKESWVGAKIFLGGVHLPPPQDTQTTSLYKLLFRDIVT